MNLKGIIDKNKNDDTDEDQKSEKEPAKVRPLLAELGHAPGTIKMTLVSSKAIEEKFIASFDNTMFFIKEFSRKVGETMDEIPFERRPSQVQLGFYIRLTTDGKAVITKSEKETNLKVILTWKHNEKNEEKEIY